MAESLINKVEESVKGLAASIAKTGEESDPIIEPVDPSFATTLITPLLL